MPDLLPAALRSRCVRFALGGACLMFSTMTHAQPTKPTSQPASRPSRAAHAEPQKLSGSVEYFNLGTNGMPESMMLKTADALVQLDFPPTAGEAIAKAAAPGAKVEATARPVDGHPGAQGGSRDPGPEHHDGAAADHRVLHLVSLTGPDGKAIDIAAASKPQATKVEGSIKHLNYGPHGELNGVVLDNGDLVRFSPVVANVLKLAPGQKLMAEGHAHALPAGHNEISADVVNGMAFPSMDHPGQSGMRPSRDGIGPQRGPRGERNDGQRHDEQRRDGQHGGPGMMGPQRMRGQGGPGNHQHGPMMQGGPRQNRGAEQGGGHRPNFGPGQERGMRGGERQGFGPDGQHPQHDGQERGRGEFQGGSGQQGFGRPGPMHDDGQKPTPSEHGRPQHGGPGMMGGRGFQGGPAGEGPGQHGPMMGDGPRGRDGAGHPGMEQGQRGGPRFQGGPNRESSDRTPQGRPDPRRGGEQRDGGGQRGPRRGPPQDE